MFGTADSVLIREVSVSTVRVWLWDQLLGVSMCGCDPGGHLLSMASGLPSSGY